MIEWSLVVDYFECQSCGALCKNKALHESFHEGLRSTAQQADHADAMTRLIGGGI